MCSHLCGELPQTRAATQKPRSQTIQRRKKEKEKKKTAAVHGKEHKSNTEQNGQSPCPSFCRRPAKCRARAVASSVPWQASPSPCSPAPSHSPSPCSIQARGSGNDLRGEGRRERGSSGRCDVEAAAGGPTLWLFVGCRGSLLYGRRLLRRKVLIVRRQDGGRGRRKAWRGQLVAARLSWLPY